MGAFYPLAAAGETGRLCAEGAENAEKTKKQTGIKGIK